MMAFRQNGYIDLRTANPVGSPNQVLHLSGDGMASPVEITLENGRVSHVTVNGRELDDSRYEIYSKDGSSTVVLREMNMHVGIHPDKITVGATNRVNEKGEPTNYLFTFDESGNASWQSAASRQHPPSQPAVQQTADHIVVEDMHDIQSRMEKVQRRNRAAENRQNWLNFNADGWLNYDPHNDHNFKSVAVGVDRNNQPTDFIMSERDESYQRFSAIINGVRGTINMNCFRDDHWILDSSATFTGPDNNQRSISVNDALAARSQTFQRMGVADFNLHEDNFTCGLPPSLESKMGLKR